MQGKTPIKTPVSLRTPAIVLAAALMALLPHDATATALIGGAGMAAAEKLPPFETVHYYGYGRGYYGYGRGYYGRGYYGRGYYGYGRGYYGRGYYGGYGRGYYRGYRYY